jgi:hypothetical protein
LRTEGGVGEDCDEAIWSCREGGIDGYLKTYQGSLKICVTSSTITQSEDRGFERSSLNMNYNRCAGMVQPSTHRVRFGEILLAFASAHTTCTMGLTETNT